MNLRIHLISLAVLAIPLGNAWCQTDGYVPLSRQSIVVGGGGESTPLVGNGACRRPLVGGGATCDGPVGGNAAIGSEVILRNGASLPIGGQTLSRDLGAGYTVGVDLRTHFYTLDYRESWFVDIGVSDSFNQARTGFTDVHTLNIIQPNALTGLPTRMNLPVTIKDYNRSFFNYGVGKEWFLWNDALVVGDNFRFAVDVGGRYGTSSARFNEIRHRTDTLKGTYVGAQATWETPTSFGIFGVGVRTEWSYTWGDILQVSSDIQEINVLLNLGIRY